METITKQTGNLNDILQLVTFEIGEEEYAIDILKVQEINKQLEITQIPNAPYYVKGIINLRGTVLPIVDLRTKLGITPKENDSETRIIVVELNDSKIGFIVDKVNEVLRIPASITEPPPKIITGKNSAIFNAVAKLEDRLIVLIDLEKAFTDDELDELKSVNS